MKYRFEKKKIGMVCISIITVTTLFGCVTVDKPSRIIAIQKNRIQNLKKQVRRQGRIIQTLKTKQRVGTKTQLRSSAKLSQLDAMMKKGLWVSALKLSSAMVQKDPQSAGIRQRRIQIFKKMGLERQADSEVVKFKKLRAQRTVSNPKKRE